MHKLGRETILRAQKSVCVNIKFVEPCNVIKILIKFTVTEVVYDMGFGK